MANANTTSTVLPKTAFHLLNMINDEEHTKLQHALTAELEHARATAIANEQTAIEKACTKSHSSRGSTILHTRITDSTEIKLPPAAQRTVSKLRTHTLTLPECLCVCGKHTLAPADILSCGCLRGRILRHDLLVEAVLGMLLAAEVVARKEVMVLENQQNRTDIVAYLGTKVYWLDISVVNSAAPTYRGKALPAIKMREGEKNRKWKKWADERGFIFVPVVFDVFGEFGAGVDRVLSIIAEKALQSYPYPLNAPRANWKAERRSRAAHHLAVVLANANHLMIEEAVRRAPKGRAWSYSNTTNLYAALWRRATGNEGRLQNQVEICKLE